MDRTIRFWSFPTGEKCGVLNQHTSPVYSLTFLLVTIGVLGQLGLGAGCWRVQLLCGFIVDCCRRVQLPRGLLQKCVVGAHNAPLFLVCQL
jgi:hypothetical protein